MWIIWAAKRAETNYIGWSCTVIKKKRKKKRWRWRWVSCAKDDPKPSWQRCLSLALISRLTKWPFSLHSDIMESYIMQLISFSVLSELRADWAGQNYPPVCFFFCFFFVVLKSSWLGESRCHLSPCRSRFFFFLIFLSPPTELKKPNLFGFSYAMVRGMITSWQGTSCQLETSYLWHLLSNCCSWTVTPPLHVHQHLIRLPQ